MVRSRCGLTGEELEKRAEAEPDEEGCLGLGCFNRDQNSSGFEKVDVSFLLGQVEGPPMCPRHLGSLWSTPARCLFLYKVGSSSNPLSAVAQMGKARLGSSVHIPLPRPVDIPDCQGSWELSFLTG